VTRLLCLLLGIWSFRDLVGLWPLWFSSVASEAGERGLPAHPALPCRSEGWLTPLAKL
jgi:hypothetical protein